MSSFLLPPVVPPSDGSVSPLASSSTAAGAVATTPSVLATVPPAELASGWAPNWEPSWTRRVWLTHHAAALVAVRVWSRRPGPGVSRGHQRMDATVAARLAAHGARQDPSEFETLAKRAVEAATAAGAQYADARLTRTVQHHYEFDLGPAACVRDTETVGVGVRALVHGYWGFAAAPTATLDDIARLAQDAVAQAQENALGPARPVDLGTVPVVTGRWTTPVQIDPFTVTLEEKADFLANWYQWGERVHAPINLMFSYLHFARQERTVATSAGSCVSQTLIESGGTIMSGDPYLAGVVQGIDPCGKGWELFLEAKIPEQLAAIPARFAAMAAARAKPATIGQYTIVCDGKLMGRLLEQTFGVATQLDRALGYEANAGGTSFITDPLGMLGTLQVASPVVTITANRSAPAELATVQWDDEAVVPDSATLVKHGVLHDFQTTREQAAWLAPYYQKAGLPVRSHGYAWAEDGLNLTLQQLPNLALEPGPAAVHLEDLIADVKEGILMMDAPDPFGTSWAARTDQQAKNGYMGGEMRQIKNGKLGPWLMNGVILFNTTELWKQVKALGGPSTQGVYASTALNEQSNMYRKWFQLGGVKGQPPQVVSHSVRGVAAVIPDQALIDPRRKA